MASSDEILCASEDECLHPRRKESHGARTEGAIFVVGVVAVQTFLTPPRYANTVARLLVSTEPLPSLPGRLCVVGAIAIQWRLVERSDTKNDRVELVTFDVGAAARQQKRSLAITFSMAVSLALRSLLLMMVLMTTAAPSLLTRLRLLTRARSCRRSHVSSERDASAIVFFCARCSHRRVPRNLVDPCSWLPLYRRNAPRHFTLHCRPRKLDIHSFMSAVAPVAVGRKVRDGVTWFPVLLAVKGEDPRKIIRYVIATRDLKDFRFADRTCKAFLEALLPKRTKDLLMEVELATCRTSLLRARPRLDLVCILLDRRILSSSRWVRYSGRCIHIQCDSSPIAGRELFGMLMDVFFLGMTWVERCLSGVAMGHGHTACRDKCMNLLWVLWLITAPNKILFADVLQHIRSFKTDQGVDAYMVTEGIETSF